ncbi:MAG: methyltransferase [Bacteroidales bacterium]|jgi:tRNA1Val (adenine37-N6)-methyltransferase|nr:methyltransferase [Bacteroidales bacterium]
MGSSRFAFKKFVIEQNRSAFKVGTDGVILGACASVEKAERILDTGAGTGLIALMLAQRCNAEIVAIEPDHESFAQMCENINASPWSNRIKAVETTLQNFRYSGKFDLIVTNPPYFFRSLKNPDPIKSQTRHNDTLKPSDILAGAVSLLNKHGALQLIMPCTEGNRFIAEATQYGLYCCNIIRIKPLPASEVKRLVLTFKRTKTVPAEQTITISTGKRHEFTGEYMELTRDFYLHF